MQNPIGTDTPNIDYAIDDQEYKVAIFATATSVLDTINDMYTEVIQGDASRITDLEAATEALREGGEVARNKDVTSLSLVTTTFIPRIAAEFNVPAPLVMKDVLAAVSRAEEDYLMAMSDGLERVEDPH